MNMNKKIILLLALFILLLPITVLADPIGPGFCNDVRGTMRFLGMILLVGKMLVPFIIIFVGSLDLYKVMTSGTQDDIKKQYVNLGKRVLAGLLIFFLPTILNLTVLLISNWGIIQSEFTICANCLLNPTRC